MPIKREEASPVSAAICVTNCEVLFPILVDLNRVSRVYTVFQLVHLEMSKQIHLAGEIFFPLEECSMAVLE
jgi:hypothetical protein